MKASSTRSSTTSPIRTRAASCRYAQAINEALALALEHDPGVFVLGQGVDDPIGDVRDDARPAEAVRRRRACSTRRCPKKAMMGVSTGAAMNGMRPVFMHNRPDFVLLAFNQLVTHAAKFHFMDNGQTTVPLVVWAAIGRGWGSGAQHSQAIHGMLLGVPGPEDRDAEHAVRRQGPAAVGHPRQQPGLRLRAPLADEEGRRRPGRVLSRADRQGHLPAPRRAT